MKTALLLRLGGLGDLLIITPVAKELAKRGYEVDACVGSPTGDAVKLLENTKLFRNLYLCERFFTGLDTYRVNPKDDVKKPHDMASVELLKEGYDLVVDYKFSVELNSHYKQVAGSGPGKEWFASQNSNYVNWCDIMLGWAGIDPAEVADEDKIPTYLMEGPEREWARRLLRNPKSQADAVVAIQTNASSLVRTWYNPQVLPKAITDEYPEKKVDIIIFDGAVWHYLKAGNSFPIVLPSQFDPIRASAALVGNCDLFVGADSGFSHIAEALQVKSLTIYTTVPAWTRSKYYKYAQSIEPIGDTFDGVRCRPCFVLDRYCPRIRERALKEFTPREETIKKAMEAGRGPADVALELQTTPQGIMKEAEMMQQRFLALCEIQAPCSQTITTERIVAKVKEMLPL